MLIKSQGIILRSIKYGETSLILDIYTRDFGMNSYIVGGVRNKKGKNKAGVCQLMSVVDIIAYHKQKKALYRIKEIESAFVYERIPFEIKRSSIGLFMTELLKYLLRENEGSEEMYDFILEWYLFLDRSRHSVTNIHLLFMIELAEQIGIQPRDNYSVNNLYFNLQEGQFAHEIPDHRYYLEAEPSEWLYDLMMMEKEYVHELSITNSQRRIILDKLIQFYQLHLETIKELNTYPILNEILS